MLVERGDRLDARWRMVHLMEDEPETMDVADAMPPVEKERASEPADEALQHRVWERGQVEQRNAGQQINPKAIGTERNDGLRQVDQNCARVPPGRVRQLAAWHEAFERKERGRDQHCAQGWKCEVRHWLRYRLHERESYHVWPCAGPCQAGRRCLTKPAPHALFARFTSRS